MTQKNKKRKSSSEKAPEKSKKMSNKGTNSSDIVSVKDIINYLSSLRFFVIVLTAIALVSSIGTVIGQNLPAKAYIERYGEGLYSKLKLLSVTDIYHSSYFNALLLLLIINLILCTIKFAPMRLRQVFSKKIKKKKYPLNKRLTSKASKEVGISKIKKALLPLLLRPFQRFAIKEDGVKTELTTEPRPYLGLGALIVHVGIILLIFGGLISSLFGLSGEMTIIEGGTSNEVHIKSGFVHKLDFNITLDKFTLINYKDGTPKEYRSDITFKGKDGDAAATLTVNHPAKFEGIRFYQTNYGKLFDSAKVSGYSKTGEKIYSGTIQKMIVEEIKDKKIKFVLMGFYENFHNQGPMAHIAVLDDNKEYEVLANSDPLEFRKPLEGKEDELRFVLDDYNLMPYSGISAVSEPGLPLVWAGFILLSVGFLFPILSFLGSYKVVITGGSDKAEVPLTIEVFGSPGRIKSDFPNKFNKLVNEIEGDLC